MKYALLMGLNYIGTDAELAGCINDIANIQNLLVSKYNYPVENIKVLTDLTENKPTYNNILQELNNLTTLPDNSTIWIHYSGHGSYIADHSNDEKDKRDECICPLDYNVSGFIIDDDLAKIFRKFKKNTNLTVIFDSCHSGSALDLPFMYNFDTRIYEKQNSNVFNANIVFISGCKDAQTSADTVFNNTPQGALTGSLLFVLGGNNFNLPLNKLIKNMRKFLLSNNYDQIPQLCTSSISISMNKMLI